MSLSRATAGELVQLYRQRAVSPVEVAETVLDRIDRLDEDLGAFRTVLSDQLKDAAARAERAILEGRPVGPLHAVPVAVKELFDVAGADGAYGSQVLAGRIAPEDAAVVTRLRDAGAMIVGTTRSHEFGWGITTQHVELGSTRNPWAPDRVPGGSSGGSAAALAAGFCPLAIGSDTGGSIRIPASFCGVLGIKPTYGRVPKRGGVALAPSLDHPGPMARDVADLNLALDVMAGYDPDDPSTLTDQMQPVTSGALRIAVCPDLHVTPLDAAYQQAFDRVVDQLERAGHPVEEISFPEADQIRPSFGSIQMAEAYHYHTQTLGTFPETAERYGEDVRRRLEMASEVGIAEYLDATEVRLRVRRRFEEIFRSGIDLVLTPVSAGGPSPTARPDVAAYCDGEIPFRDLVMDYTVPQDLAGLPAASFPVGLDPSGVPIGLQYTGAWGRERDVLSAVASTLSELGPVGTPAGYE